MGDKSVDVIIPAFNAAKYIGETLKSVIEQTVKPTRIIVVDDGSEDDTAEVVRSFRNDLITLLSVERKGVSAARNAGIALASSKYVAFCDSDDIWEKDKLAKQFAALESDDRAKVVYCGTSLIDDASKDIPNSTGVPYVKGMIFEDIVFYERPIYGSASAVMVERLALNEVGLFDERMQFSEDVDLWARLAKKFEFTFAEDACVKIRVHNSSATRAPNWGKDKRVLLQHFYYINKYADMPCFPDKRLEAYRGRVIRLFLGRNSVLSDYPEFCRDMQRMAPILYKKMGNNLPIFSVRVFITLCRQAFIRSRDRLMLVDRTKLFLAEGTIFFSHSKNYSRDAEYMRKRD